MLQKVGRMKLQGLTVTRQREDFKTVGETRSGVVLESSSGEVSV